MLQGPLNRLAQVLALCACVAAARPVVQQKPALPVDDLPAELGLALPLGLPEILPVPADNPVTPERLALGRRLFFDPLLSRDESLSCASCHRPDHGFASPEALSLGVGGVRTLNNAPTLFNRAFARHFMWDGRVDTLEEQVLLPVGNELEMDLPLADAVARLRSHAEYGPLFEQAFGEPASAANLGRALATFVRHLVIGDSPVDRFRSGGVQGALTDLERTGMWVFDSKGRCWKCHVGPNFSDEGFHNSGIGAVGGEPLPGRFAVTGEAADRGRFKTPTLRALSMTAPYMHNGSLASLEDVVEFYRGGGNPNDNLDVRLAPIDLTEREAAGLVAFLEALSRQAE